MSASNDNLPQNSTSGDHLTSGDIGAGAAAAIGRDARAESHTHNTTINANPQVADNRGMVAGVIIEDAHAPISIHTQAPALTPDQLRNRRTMLQLVNNIWVKGILEKSLYHELLIELGMEQRTDATVVERPWDTIDFIRNNENGIMMSECLPMKH